MKIFYYLFSLIIFCLAIFCIIYPSDMIAATRNGLSLWITIILPSLFPFLILSELIQKTAITKIFSKLLSPIMRPIFKLPGVSSVAIFLGMTGGYPIGAKVTSDLRKSNSLSQIHARRLISFANNSGPLFISGAIGIGLYRNPSVGLILLISHYISALLVGFLFRFYKPGEVAQASGDSIHFEIIKISDIGFALANTIKKALNIVMLIGGFIIMFSIITSILAKTGILLFLAKSVMPFFPESLSISIITGFMEVTNGVSKLATLNSIALSEKLIATSVLVGFGGLSVHMQTLSVLSDSDIGVSTYLIGKILQGIFSGAITFLLLYYTNFSLLIAQTTFAGSTYSSYGFIKLVSAITIMFLFIVAFKIIQVIRYK